MLGGSTGGLNGAAEAEIAEANSVVSLRYMATCRLIVELRGPLSCWTAVKKLGAQAIKWLLTR